jgi:HPt (histidine-containing phosphotransfer) domain-containing protein
VKATLKICDLSVALGRMGGNKVLLGQMAQFLFDSAPELINRLEQAAREGQTDTVLRAAHNLRGLVVNFDAEAVAQTLLRIESNGRAGDSSHMASDVEEAQQRLNELLHEIQTSLPRV